MAFPLDEAMPLPCASTRDEKTAVLAVGPDQAGHAALDGILHTAGWKLYHAATYEEARACLRRYPLRIVICETALPGCGWKGLLDQLRDMAQPPMLIVTSRLADDSLWAEVLNLGGYDVLVQPFEREEVVRVIGAASRRFDSQGGRQAVSAIPA